MGALVRYHGGKVRIAGKIVGIFPAHNCYVEPFGGGAAVLLAKQRCKLEIYNDLDGEVVNLFRTIREDAEELARAVSLTPWARDEQELSYRPTENPVERARRFLVRSHFGHGCGTHKKRVSVRRVGDRISCRSIAGATFPTWLWTRPRG